MKKEKNCRSGHQFYAEGQENEGSDTPAMIY
jgi:hypothetical protein